MDWTFVAFAAVGVGVLLRWLCSPTEQRPTRVGRLAFDPGMVAEYAQVNGGRATVLRGGHPGARFDTPHGTFSFGAWRGGVGRCAQPLLHLRLEATRPLRVERLRISARQAGVQAAGGMIAFATAVADFDRRFALHRASSAEPRAVLALAARLRSTLENPALQNLVLMDVSEEGLHMVLPVGQAGLEPSVGLFWQVFDAIARESHATSVRPPR
jgi:hypothetical protein